jgi:hypothetical protein
MAIVLLIAGIGFFLAGLVQIALGVPVKEFSFGNTLMITGAVTSCTGAVMIGIWIAVREFRNTVQRLGAVAPQYPAAAFPAEPGPAVSPEPIHENDGFAFDRGQPTPAHAAEAPLGAPATVPSPPPSSPPWHDEAAGRDRGRADMAGGPPADPAVKQRRNLLFSSTSRKERERREARTTDAPAADADSIPPVVPPPARAGETPSATFEEAWPQQRRGGRTPSTFTEAGAGAAVADRSPPAPRTDEPAPVTVLKSGVVDGMAYSLYSDGSIEAQMPEGMMRFASIDELRAHLDQRG